MGTLPIIIAWPSVANSKVPFARVPIQALGVGNGWVHCPSLSFGH